MAALRSAGCVFAEDEAHLLLASGADDAELGRMLGQRVAGIPLEHILGWVEFCGLRIGVDEGVFVPRRRTEFLVQQAALLAQPGDTVLDLCCGCGALGIALEAAVGGLDLYAADIEPAAVACAKRNLGLRDGHVLEGDLFQPVPVELRGRLAIVLCNTPYVPTAAIGLLPPEARLHEPLVTLDGGADGLDIQRRVAAEVLDWLAPDGALLVETSEEQAPVAAEIFAANGLLARVERSEELFSTVVIGTRPTVES